MAPSSVAIVGGGPAGGAAALELARAGVRVCVYDSTRPVGEKIGETLPPNAMPLLRHLGLAGPAFEQTHLPSHGIRCVWGSPTPLDRDFLFERHGSGWHLDRRRFEQSLIDVARRHGAEWRSGATVRFPQYHGGRWRFSVNGREEFADALVDATGRACTIARALGIRRVFDDRLVGVACVYEATCREITDSFTLIEAAQEGWWYSAVVPGGKVVVVFFTDADLTCYRTARTANGFSHLMQLTRYTRDRLAHCQCRATQTPANLPAGDSHLSSVGGPAWLAAGDAAAAFDPLSSYGIVHAIGSGYYAARTLYGAYTLPEYADLISHTWLTCRQGVSFLYDLERRWPAEPFWRRRRSVAR